MPRGIYIRRKDTKWNPWMKGLTKETDPRIARIAELNREWMIQNNPFRGKHHSEETKTHLREVLSGRKLSSETREKIRNNGNKGRKFSEEFCRKCSLSKIGNKSRLGIPHSEETKKKISESQLGKEMSIEFRHKMSNIMKILWKTPKYILMQMERRKVKPNKTELRFTDFLDTHFPGEWKYVGDGKAKVVIGGKVPDWMNINGKKKLIELYGDYYHQGDNPQDKMDIYAEFGFDCLVIWEHELKEKSEEELVEIIKNFNNS